MFRNVTLALTFALAAGCATAPMRNLSSDEKESIVARHAAHDFECADPISVSAIDPMTLDATACGQTTTYFLECKDPKNPKTCDARRERVAKVEPEVTHWSE